MFLPTGWFKWKEPKEFDSNKYRSNSSTESVLKVDLECPKELHDFHDDYRLAPDKIKIKSKMLSNWKLKIVGFYDIPFRTVKKLGPKLFGK